MCDYQDEFLEGPHFQFVKG